MRRIEDTVYLELGLEEFEKADDVGKAALMFGRLKQQRRLMNTVPPCRRNVLF